MNNKISFPGSFFLFFCLLGNTAFSQKLREIIITQDTVKEINKSIGLIEDARIQDGIKMYLVDSLNKTILIETYKQNQLNGDFYAFYLEVNMLEKKGEYKNGKKHGRWYYWNPNGVLLRTEIWQEDKLISTKSSRPK